MGMQITADVVLHAAAPPDSAALSDSGKSVRSTNGVQDESQLPTSYLLRHRYDGQPDHMATLNALLADIRLSPEAADPMISLNFRTEGRTMLDPITGIKIYLPRVSPAATAADVDRREFEYPIYRGANSYDFRTFGHETLRQEHGRREHHLALRIDHDWILEDALDLKSRWDIGGENYAFLCELATGLIGVLAQRDHASDDARYTALADINVLAGRGIALPRSAVDTGAGQVVLAELRIQSSKPEGDAV